MSNPNASAATRPRTEQDPRASRHNETAARHAVADVPRARPDQTVAEVLDALLAQPSECIDLVCVLDAGDHLVGVVPLAALLALPRDTRVGQVANLHFPKVHDETDQERVASLALHHELSAIPVTDAQGRLVGVVPAPALLHILRREHVEDIHRFAGITRETLHAREAIEEPPLRRLRHRLPWLLLGLVGSVLATFIVVRFERALSVNPAIAFFVPGLVYLADAIGTQTEAVAVRGLSLSHARLSTLIGGELRTGVLIGLVLGGLTLPAVWLAFGDWSLAFAVSGALVAAGGIATTIGLALPWLLGRLGSDPAYGSGPLATIVQDLLSLLTYFLIVSAVVL
ncbi:MAG: magnesium transporter [Gammaproteobacteria bacterium]|uniref:magnesium transporter n=1 Tax=Hydrogenophaga sp. TaxID=1904254 RepID=UPI000CC0EF9D|nr:magnesium transporter [Hydrogenophaga sp.]MBU4181549.1 magnesium transporter [Gammaproteobacteria bacterium]PKO76305.1 MAG: magnesium transporter [Betaproteobacteria bacterium HGW-Betaproteobacteria-15]MBU4282830.1 magnesium transporter [Gammaproteobacteria bacterium]MBU4324976.1 magnesium transporter [Gammaproteobacteria bacterium]MBU4506013.1 magnesium transporter [Gammaproteobacteria bacterium]